MMAFIEHRNHNALPEFLFDGKRTLVALRSLADLLEIRAVDLGVELHRTKRQLWGSNPRTR